MKRFHVYLGNKRTTVSIDDMLVDFLAIKLQCWGDSDEHGTIRAKLQRWLDEVGDPRQVRVSQYLHRKIFEYMSDNKISDTYNEAMIEQEKQEN